MRFLLILISLYSFSSGIFANEIKQNCEKVIREYFGAEVEFTFFEYEIEADLKNEIEKNCGQKFFKSKLVVWEIKKNDTLHAAGLLDNVLGKSLPITFLTLFDKSGNILKSDIIKYRESHGGGVAGQSWMNQFAGRNENSSFAVGQEIQIISGATISSHSVSKGVKKLTYLIKPILDLYENKTASVK